MDVRQTFYRLLIAALALITLTACETKSSSDTLEVLGTVPRTVYLDSYFQFEVGVAGGEGPYSYRFIQNPEVTEEEDEEEPVSSDFNDLQLTIREGFVDGKSSVIVSGIPSLKEDESFESFRAGRIRFGIEVKDHTTGAIASKNFITEVESNTLRFATQDLQGFEGRVLNSGIDSLNRLFTNEGEESIACLNQKGSAFEIRELENGVRAYPLTFFLGFFGRVSKPVEIQYRLTSRYNDSASEFSSENLGEARPGVDFISEEGTILFETGKSACVLVVYVMDDNVIEGDESLRVEFTDRTGALVALEGSSEEIVIRDNEPEASYELSDITINRGGSISIPVELSRPHDVPVSISFWVDPVASSLKPNSYQISPESGVLNFLPGFTDDVVTIDFDLPEAESAGAEEFAVVRSSIDAFAGVEASRVGLNSWAGLNPDKEIVAAMSEGQEAVDFAVLNGDIFVLSEETENGLPVSVISGFTRSGSPLSLNEGTTIRISQSGEPIKPVAIAATQVSAEKQLTVVAQVSSRVAYQGNLATGHYGGDDFAVFVFEKSSDDTSYSLTNLEQFGSEQDDAVKGVSVDTAGGIYIFGSTSGELLDGANPEQINMGGRDGFVYRLVRGSLDKSWARFIGTENQDTVNSLDVGRNNLAVVIESESSDIDPHVFQLATNTGEVLPDTETIRFATPVDENVASLRFDHNRSNLVLAASSQYDFATSRLNTSGTVDGRLVGFDFEGRISGNDQLATAGSDVLVSFERQVAQDIWVAAGVTNGAFEGNSNAGLNDAFIAVINKQSGTVSEQQVILNQFGTPGDDRVIAVKVVDERKFYVLWTEDYSDPAKLPRYRISAFSAEGDKLTPAP